jgi:ubiquinone/menaquinone biosynthesis C-methylase UbiE
MKRGYQPLSRGAAYPEAGHQAAVDNYFEREAHYWKSAYRRLDPAATVLQERTRRSLQWVEELGLMPGSKVLDAGCGAGMASVALARCGYRVHAVDHVPAMLSLTREWADHAGVRHLVSASLADVCSLPFQDDYFDLVISLGVIGWLESPEKAIREISRVLQRGGHVVLSAGNSRGLQDMLNPAYNPVVVPLHRKLVRWFRRVGWLPPSIIRARLLTRWRRSEIDQMLRVAGLQKVRNATVGFGPFRFFRRNLFPDSFSMKVHHKLQAWADRNIPVLRSTGAVHVVLSHKP